MARISKANTIIAIDNMATELTTMFQDDTLTETAEEYKHPFTPLRMLAKLLVFNVSTGVWTTNADYVNAGYDGNWAYKGDGKNDIGAPKAIGLVSATIEPGAPNDIVLTFDRSMTDNQNMSTAIGGAAAAGKTIKGEAVSFAVVTITVSAPFIAADVVTVSGRFFGGSRYVDLLDQAITNNII